MATTRLRHAFKYPADADLPPDTTGIDEQEQEQLITQLRTQDTETTRFYRSLFLTFPVVAALPFVYYLVTNPSSQTLLALSSLAATGWVLYGVPVGQEEAVAASIGGKGPLARWLVVLNGLLAAMLAVSGLVAARMSDGIENREGILAVLPLVIFVTIMLVRSQLNLVDVDGLSRLKYDYKGA